MPLLQQVQATPTRNEAVLLFVDRAARPDRLSCRTRGTIVSILDVTVGEELCDPRHFLPRWWQAPEKPEQS